jgi:hypothetical protein
MTCETTSAITGHLAMFQAVRVVSPRPITSPTPRASGPVRTMETVIAAAISTSRTVTAI